MPKAKRTDEIFPRIRAMIMKIPRGKVSSYGAIAAAAGFPKGARLTVRALSQAHGLPWHRVVAAGGRIATPGEGGLDQRFRLEMEGVKFSGKKVRMAEFEFKFAKKASRRRPQRKLLRARRAKNNWCSFVDSRPIKKPSLRMALVVALGAFTLPPLATWIFARPGG